MVALMSNDLEIVVYEAERDHLQGRYTAVSRSELLPLSLISLRYAPFRA